MQKNNKSWLGNFPFGLAGFFWTCLFASFLLIYIVYILLFEFPSFSPDFTTSKFTENLNGLLLFFLCALYFLTSRFYQDIFFFLLSIGWGLIGIQTYFTSIFILNNSHDVQNFLVLNGLLSIIETIPFYIAAKLSPNLPSNSLKIPIALFFWFTQISITTLMLSMFTSSDVSSNIWLSQIPFASWTLILVGKEIKNRLSLEPISKLIPILSLSFYFYGILQFFYILMYLGSILSTTYLIVFYIGMLVKFVNGLCLFRIIIFEFKKLTEQHIQQNVFEDIGLLTASIEHEMRNPLMVLQTDIQIMKQRFQHNEQLLPFIYRLKMQADRIFAASQIISYLRKDTESVSNFMGKEEIEIIIRQTIKLLKKTIDTSNIYFKINKSKTIYARIYSPMFEQALLNILKNAIEAIKEAKRDSGQINIEIIDNFPEKYLFSINIKDNGCGILKEDIPKLTSIFSTKKNQKLNSGIGLFVCERIIKIHRGQLKVASKIGEGAMVSIILPKWSTEKYAGNEKFEDN